MPPEIERLLIIQDRDRKLRTLRLEHKNAPLEKQAFADKLAAAQKQLEAVKLKSKEIEVERKKLETEAQSVRERIAKYQVQKFETRKNEEFSAINHEIARAEKDVQAIEDRELELMDAAEKQKAVIAEADRIFTATKAQATRQTADLDTKIVTLGEQIAAGEVERAKLAAEIEEDVLDNYEHLLRTKNGEAVVSLHLGICSGCHMKVTPTTSSQCRTRKSVVHCEQCGRMLYWED
ncbi:MAG: C4-type zinc ribbon domain-containing protein [Chthoniobacteraceae bacterium]